jgi:hypothetical protein
MDVETMQMLEDFKEVLRIRKFKILKAFLLKYDKIISPASLAIGFTVDILTLTRVDLFFDNLILISQLTFAGTSIFVLNAYESNRLRSPFWDRMIMWFPYVLQFAFGGLFSGFLVLYTRSATVAASWPFLFMLLALFLSNEINQERYRRLIIQLSLYYFCLFAYFIFAFPVLFNKLSAWIFVLSGIIAIFIIRTYVYLLSRVAPWKIKFNESKIMSMVAIIFILFNVLYFTNIIPPIPLSSKEMILAYYVQPSHTAQGTTYHIEYDKAPWWQVWRSSDGKFYRVQGARAYVYTSIYAPADISSDIIHEWSYKNSQGNWIVTDQISYPIFGGRENGYRGYSLKGFLTPGPWRVDIKNDRGQVIGRTTFTVVASDIQPELEILTR